MIFIPAIDLKNNKCVRLIRGKEEKQTIFNENPIRQAIVFEESGCERLHIVDLDGAFGRPNINKDTILKIKKETTVPIQLGGGIKNKEEVSFWLNEGIDFLIQQAFYHSDEAELIWEEIIYPDNYYLDKYLASVKLNEIFDENCIIINKYTEKEFFNKILNFDSTPFYLFNELLD